MNIKIITHDKKRFLSLLLLADEQENMIDKYLERGELFALYNGDLKSICVVTDEGGGTYEIKNLATSERYQRQGFAKALLDYIGGYYRGRCKTMIVGTCDSPVTVTFYQKCGFVFSHIVPNFFTENYDHPIIENGVLLTDMIYFKKSLDPPVRGECRIDS